MTDKSKFLIIGAGTWGCSIALELARRGYRGIKVLDGSPFPSPTSAGNDLNKIVEQANECSETDSDEEYFWNRINQIAIQSWKRDPLYRPFYHPTGLIMCCGGEAAWPHCVKYAEDQNAQLVPLNTKEDFHATMPEGVLTGPFPGWRGYWKRTGAGWVSAIGALRAMHTEAVKLGVQFITQPRGQVERLLYSTSGDTILGARTADGIEHLAEQTVLSAGASNDLLLDFKKQLRPTAWTLAHIPLAAKEAEKYRNLPVLYGVDRGFFIEPDLEKHEIKMVDEHPGYINLIQENGVERSFPFARQQIPQEAESRMRRFLRETMPQFQDRKFSFARVCWDTDTVDRIFLIDRHPDLKNLIVAAGGSGNGFMTNPAVGKVVADLVDDKLEARLKRILKWRPEIAVNRDWWHTQERFGAEGKVMDFKNVGAWTTIGQDAKL